MDIHNRFVNVRTTGSFIYADNPEKKSSKFRDLLKIYNNEIYSGSADLKNLELFRILLCHEYQSSISSSKSYSPSESTESHCIDLNKFFVRDSPDFFDTQEFALLYDIATLQLALMQEEKQFVRTFKDFCNTRNGDGANERAATDLCLRVYECFADASTLHSHLYGKKSGEKDSEELRHCVLSAIQSWLNQEEKREWRLLGSLLPKLAMIFDAQNIATPLWKHILGYHDDLGKSLAAMCVVADVCFPSEEEKILLTSYEHCFEAEFWFIVLRGLASSVYQERKQALYLTKRVVDFVESHRARMTKELDSSKKNIVPFICTSPAAEKHATDRAKRIFYLIFESLEEKQKHLVLPALTHLPALSRIYSQQKSCCFAAFWLRCLFMRILQHDNSAIKIAGLREILKADLDIYDEDFMHFLATALNQTLLYEYDEIDEEEPNIVKRLEEFFLRAEEEKILLINDFVRTISTISWCPVAIYWILRAVVGASEHKKITHNIWTSAELKCVKNLMEEHLTKHSKILRKHSLFLILRAFRAYTGSNSCQFEVELVTSSLTFLYESLCGGNVKIHALITECSLTMIKPSEAQLHVVQMCETLKEKKSMKSCAIIIILLTEANLILNAKNCSAERALCKLLENLVGANVRPYADSSLVAKIMELVLHLKNLNGDFSSGTSSAIDRIFFRYWEPIFQLIEKNFDKTGISKFHEYTTIIDLCNFRSDERYISEFLFGKLHIICMNILNNPKEFSKNQWLHALKIVNTQFSITRRSTSCAFSEACVESALGYLKDEILIEDKRENKEINVAFKGRFVWECCANVAKLVSKFVQTFENDQWPRNVHWLKELRLLVETGTEEVIAHIAAGLHEIFHSCPSMITENINTVDSIIRLSWRTIFQSKKTDDFFLAVEKLMRVIVHPDFLKLEGAKEFAVESVEQLMEEGNNVPALKIIFIEAISETSAENALHFQKPFVSCLLHGSVPRLDQRIERAAISNCNDDPAKNGEMHNNVRARSIHTLLSFLNKSEDCELGGKVLGDVLSMLNKNRNKRYFHNSHLHRMKHRAMQVLLLLEPYLDRANRHILCDTMCDLLIAESNQQSVRLMQEWLLVRMFEKFTTHESIWELFNTAAEIRPGSIVSVASIVFHVSRLLEAEKKHKFIIKALSYLLPNCMSQQFNVRLYSQVILVKMYEMLPQAYNHQCAGIYDGVRESLRRGNLTKNSPKIMDDFYFTIFHPNDSFDLEIIYHELPRLTGLPSDEWIEFVVFSNLPIPMSNPSFHRRSIRTSPSEKPTDWATIKPVKQSQRPTGDLDEEMDLSVDEGLNDIQKKVIPWKSMMPFSDDLSEISKAALTRRNMKQGDAGIIVVASLIDRPPNLGGLARTCEIFGAKELVIGSLRYADDREFQALSVSAEKWIKITEVKPHLLKNYLLEQRSKGWKLVGAEQTANSTNLLQMDFDEKTILLLGNEKDGIPANLIQIMDTCVEIPQNGVVRSLNVHVTGAICIWQYAKQHVLS